MRINYEQITEIHPEELLESWVEDSGQDWIDYDEVTIVYFNKEFTVTAEELEELHYLKEEEVEQILEYWDEAGTMPGFTEVLRAFRGLNERDFWFDMVHESLLCQIGDEAMEVVKSYLDWDQLMEEAQGDFLVTDSYVFEY